MSSKEVWEPVLATNISGRRFEMTESGHVTEGTMDRIEVGVNDYISFIDSHGNRAASCDPDWGSVFVQGDGTIRVSIPYIGMLMIYP